MRPLLGASAFQLHELSTEPVAAGSIRGYTIVNAVLRNTRVHLGVKNIERLNTGDTQKGGPRHDIQNKTAEPKITTSIRTQEADH